MPENIEFTTVSQTQPTAEQLQDLRFAWLCVKHVKSNAITVAKGQRLLGMGSGQPNRVKSVEIALEKAGEDVKVSSGCLIGSSSPLKEGHQATLCRWRYEVADNVLWDSSASERRGIGGMPASASQRVVCTDV